MSARRDPFFRLEVGGLKRRYLVHEPPAHGSVAVPVVLMLHGTGATARWTLNETGWAAASERASFLAVLPEGVAVDRTRPAHFLHNPLRWHDTSGRGSAGSDHVDDVAFLAAVLDDLPRRYAIDARRIYVTGFSGGGALAFRLAAELSARIAAVAPVACSCKLAAPRLARPVPTLYLSGTQDPLVPVDGGAVKTPWGTIEQQPSLVESFHRWVTALGCSPQPHSLSAEEGITVVTYPCGTAGTEVLWYKVEGLGHHWPGGKGQLTEVFAGPRVDTLRATELIWDFFARHALA